MASDGKLGRRILLRGIAAAVLIILAIQYFSYFRRTFTQDVLEIMLPTSLFSIMFFVAAYMLEGSRAIKIHLKAIIVVAILLFVISYLGISL